MNSFVEEHRNLHRQLMEAMDNIRILLTPERLSIPLNNKAAHRMLCHFVKLVKTHLYSEHHNRLSVLMPHQNDWVKSLVCRFGDGEMAIYQFFDNYHKTFLKKRRFDFSSNFLAETLDMFDRLERHIHIEECTLFPTLEVFSQSASRPRPHGNIVVDANNTCHFA
ncbi:putative Hemerythrin HHE cation binding domain-containing protein [Gammaproteobacteria bacterium]